MRIFLVLSLLFPVACVNAGEDRAERDEQVGKARIEGVRVDVHEGLAAVRRLSERELSLWAGAPVVSFTLEADVGHAGPWTILIENALADAELSALAEDGEPIGLMPLDTAAPTEKRFSLDLPPGTATFTLKPLDADATEPFRFAVYADVQEKLNQVQDIYVRMNAHPGIRFALISGDLTSIGTREQLEQFQREMKSLQFPCYATLGNHELGTQPELYHEYFGRGNYRFVFRSVQFTMLDSASANISPGAYRRLEGWLTEGKDRVHVVTMHIPPVDPVGLRGAGFANRGEASKLVKDLADGLVDTCFYGHIHSFYAFDHAGIPAFISGGGGAIPERLDGIGRHFLSVDVTPLHGIDQVAVVRVD